LAPQRAAQKLQRLKKLHGLKEPQTPAGKCPIHCIHRLRRPHSRRHFWRPSASQPLSQPATLPLCRPRPASSSLPPARRRPWSCSPRPACRQLRPPGAQIDRCGPPEAARVGVFARRALARTFGSPHTVLGPLARPIGLVRPPARRLSLLPPGGQETRRSRRSRHSPRGGATLSGGPT